MDGTLVLVASLGYLVATLTFGAWMLRFEERWARIGAGVTTFALAAHLGAVVVRVVSGTMEAGVYDLLLVTSAGSIVERSSSSDAVYLIVRESSRHMP